MKTLNSNILTGAFLAVVALNGQTTGSVAGVVLENGSRPLAGAVVAYAGAPHFETDSSGHLLKDSSGRLRYERPQVGGTVLSRADGTFTISSLPAGQYTICARGTLPIHISSCAWNTSGHGLTIASGQNQTGLQLSVTRGAVLDIAIIDSAGCATRNSKAPVYVFLNSMSQQAYLVSASSGAFHYQAVVPQQVPLRVSSNHGCSFADSNGNALTGHSLPIPAVQGESASVTMTAR